MGERTPPHSKTMEDSVIGAIVKDPRVVPLVMSIVKPKDFYGMGARIVYQNCIELYDAIGSIDQNSLYEKVDTAGNLEKVGGGTYLMGLTQGVAVAQAEYYAKKVKTFSRLRGILAACSTAQEDIYAANGQAPDLIEKVSADITETIASLWTDKGNTFTGEDIMRAAMTRLSEIGKGGATFGLETQYPDLNKIISAFVPSQMTIIAGRPSMGKTTFALNLTHHLVTTKQARTMFVSIESSADEIAHTLIAMDSGIKSEKIRTGILSPEQWSLLAITEGRLSRAPIIINDAPSPTLMDVRAMAKMEHAREPLGLIVIDYLQLVKSRERKRYERRDLEVGEISGGLKALAKELQIPIIVLAQLNRAVESREGNRPRLSDLRESGSIEQDADVVMFLHRPGYYNQDAIDKTETRLIVAKNRHGPTGEAILRFNLESAEFVSASRTEDKEDYHSRY